MTGNYIDRDLLAKVYDRVEPEILSLVESGQQEECHFDYFYLIEKKYYPPGFIPVKRDQGIEPPMWDWKDYPEFQ